MKLIIHIGYPKAGSTTLQRIFTKSKNINYMGKYVYGHNRNHPVFKKEYLPHIRKIFFCKDKQFNKDFSEIQSFFFKKLKKNKTNVLSDEIFLMPLISPWFDKTKILKRFIKIFTYKKKIKLYLLIVKRNHWDILKSYFSDEYLRVIQHNYKLKDFEYLLFSNNKRDKKILDSFKYFKTIQKIKKLNKNIKIKLLNFEELEINKIYYLKKIIKFLKIKNHPNEFSNILLNSSSKKNRNIYSKDYDLSHFYYESPFLRKFINTRFFNFVWKNKYVKKISLKNFKKFYFNEKNIDIINKYYYDDNLKLNKILKNMYLK